MAMERLKIRGDNSDLWRYTTFILQTLQNGNRTLGNEASAPVPATVPSSVICNTFRKAR